MESEWRSTTWGDEISLEYGKAIRGYSAESGQYRVFGSNGPIGWHSECLAKGPGVILGRKGAYRGVKFSKDPFFVIDTAYYVRPKTTLDMRWLYYAIIYYRLGEIDDGSPIPSTTRAAVYVRELEVPPIDEQAAIAGVLGSIDDKIEMIQKTNTTLERVARAIFKSWFVDFDPVRAKAEGREPEGMDAATAALFPCELIDSERGSIPKGWAVASLDTCLDFKEGPGIRNWQYTNSDDGVRFINIRCIKSGDLDIKSASRVSNLEGNGKYAHFHLAAWDLVVSTSGTLGRSAIVRPEHLPLLLNTSVIRFRPIHPITFSYVHGYLNSKEFLDELNAQATGSVQRNFGPMHLKRMTMLLPDDLILSKHEQTVKPLFARILHNRSLSDNLTSLLDTLLPRLISGKLRVPEAEAMLSEVV